MTVHNFGWQMETQEGYKKIPLSRASNYISNSTKTHNTIKITQYNDPMVKSQWWLTTEEEKKRSPLS